jgi:hypothetical protein
MTLDLCKCIVKWWNKYFFKYMSKFSGYPSKKKELDITQTLYYIQKQIIGKLYVKFWRVNNRAPRKQYIQISY